MIKDTSKQMAKVAVEALKEKKGYDVKVIDISEISILADYFIIANGSNANQVQAMVDNVEEQMYKAGFDDPKVEGYNNASWILLDYNDVVIIILFQLVFSHCIEILSTVNYLIYNKFL